MRFVHQDLGLIPSLTVLENLLIEELSTTADWSVSWRAARTRALELFSRFGLALDPADRVGDLRPVHRALLAIVRAVSSMPEVDDAGRGGLLVLDEPTVYLPKDDTQLLFDVTRRVAESGAGVLFVSHDLDEVEGADRPGHRLPGRPGRRDGRHRRHVLARDRGDDRRSRAGRGGPHRGPRAASADAPVQVEVQGLRGGQVERADFAVRTGEILGVTGLSGSGFEDLPYLLFGVGSAESGTVVIAGTPRDLPGLSPARAFRSGVALVPADRQRDGAVLSLSVLDNVVDAGAGPVPARAVPEPQPSCATRLEQCLSQFAVRPDDPTLTCSSLSGGNQQKVLMAKWLQTRPTLLLVHEPTQGVDVGAREEIFAVLRYGGRRGHVRVVRELGPRAAGAALRPRPGLPAGPRSAPSWSARSVTKEAISEHCYAAPSALEGTPS